VILDSLEISRAEFEWRTGWVLRPDGACKGHLCVPVAAGADRAEVLDVRSLAERLGMALVRDDAHGVWALGPETVGGRALAGADAPELALPDWRGGEFRLSSLRGRKVLLLAWASW
jgi:hypothetical protein